MSLDLSIYHVLPTLRYLSYLKDLFFKIRDVRSKIKKSNKILNK